MTRAARELAQMAQAWSRRPSAPDRAWLPPAPDWFARFPNIRALRDGLDRLYARGEVAWGWVAESDGAAWYPRDEPAFGTVVWCDDPYGDRFPEELGGIVGEYESIGRRQSVAPGLRSVRVPDSPDRSPGIRRFPRIVSRGRVVWQASLVFYPDQLPSRALRACRIPIVRARDGEPDRISVLPPGYWAPGLVKEWTNAEE